MLLQAGEHGGTVGVGHGFRLLDELICRVSQPGTHQAQIGKARKKDAVVAVVLGHNGIDDLRRAGCVTLALAVGGRRSRG